jgi:uncharacterized membrane protein YsdA (DUF1294 family)/cold shock CspA family protein
MQSSFRRGKLTKWKDDRGFGFIQPIDGSQEVFLHISEVKDATRRPQKNDTIYYHCVGDSDGKVCACNAFILGARNKAASLSNHPNLSHRIVSSFPIAEVVVLSLLPLVGTIHFTWTTRNPLPMILYPVMSLLTYALYADDKSRAKQQDWRTSEQTLHLCELAGGWLGGFIAQRILRHKSRKKSYQAAFWVIVVIHYIAWLFWLFY